MLIRGCVLFLFIVLMLIIVMMALTNSKAVRVMAFFVLMGHIGACVTFALPVLKYSTSYTLTELNAELRKEFRQVNNVLINPSDPDEIRLVVDNWNNKLKLETENYNNWTFRENESLSDEFKYIIINDDMIRRLVIGEICYEDGQFWEI